MGIFSNGKIRQISLVLLGASFSFLFLTANVSAAVTVTPATGGGAISADTTADGYTTLTGPTASEGANRDIPATGTFILTAPTGFVFNTAATVTATITRIVGSSICFNFSSLSATPTASTITFTVNRRDGNTGTPRTRCQVTFSNIQVRPSAGTPLANGDLRNTGTNTGFPRGTTNYGSLTEVAGAKNKLGVTVQPSPTAAVNTDFGTKPTVQVQDQFGNPVTTDNASPISHSVVQSNQICGGTPGSGTLSSTPASGATVSSGLLAYTAMQYSAAENIKVCFASTGLAATTTNAVSVQNPIPTTTSINPSTKTVADPEFSLTVNGTNFVSGSTVTFNGSARATSYVSPTQVTATILATDLLAATSSALIRVVNSAPGGGVSNAQTLTINNPVPTTSSIDPTSKIVGDPQFTLTVNGSNLTSSSIVKFNGLARATTYISPTQITATVLASDLLVATSSVQITVSNPAPGGGTSNAQSLAINNPVPVSTSINPTTKTAGDPQFTLTVNGSNFVNGVSSVRFNGSARATTFVSSVQLSATILASDLLTSTSSALVTVFNSAPGGGVSNAQTLTINNPVPSITVISPTNKTIGDPEFILTVTGTNFTNTSIVRVNGGDRASTYASSSVLTATIPASDLLASTTLAITVFSPSPGGGESNTKSLAVSPVPIIPAKFVITEATDGTIDLPSQVTIQAQSATGELATAYEQDVTLVTTGSATGGGLINIINGVGSTTLTDTVVEPVHLSLEDSQNTHLDVSSTKDISFGPGATSLLSITSSSTALVAGERLPITVAREDRLGHAVSAGSESYYLYSNSSSPNYKFYDAASGGNIVTTVLIPNGSAAATFWYYDEKVGTPTVTVSDHVGGPDGNNGIDDATHNVTVTSAPASSLLITNPGDLAAGQRLAYEVSRQDQFGNVSDNGSLTVYLYHDSSSAAATFYDAASAGNKIYSLALNSGVATSSFWFYGERAEPVSVTVSDNPSHPDGSDGINDASDNLTISPGPVAIFNLNNPGDLVVGNRLAYTVSRTDAFTNPVTSGETNVYLYHDAVGTSTLFYDAASEGSPITHVLIAAAASQANFWFGSNDPGSYTVKASDNASAPDGPAGVADASDAVTVSSVPIVATRLVISDPTDKTVGETAAITVRAEDNAGNLASDFNNSVTLHTTGSATPGGLVTLVDGIGTINILDTKAENVILSLEDTAHTGLDVSSTKMIVFQPGPTAKFTMAGAGTALAGERIGELISRFDQYDNTVTSGVDTVHLYSTAPAGTASFYNAASGGSQILSTSILDTAPSANVWFAGTKAGTWTLAASDNPSTPDGATGLIDGTSTVNISPAATARLFLNDPGDMFNDTRLGYSASRFDAYDNPVTAGGATYYLYSNSTGTSTAFYLAPAGGSPVTTLNFANAESTANFWYYEAKNGIWTVYLSDNSSAPDGAAGLVDGEDGVTVSAVPIVATKFIIVADASALINTPVTVTIRAVDNNNDIDSSYQNDVTLHASGAATGAGKVDIVDGVGHMTISDTVEETVNLSLSDSESTGLDTSHSASIAFSKTPVIPTGVFSRGGGGGGTISPAIALAGLAFPKADLELMAVQDGQVPIARSASGQISGTFNANYSGSLPSGINTFALVVYDKDKQIAQTKLFKLGANDQINKTIFLAPTLSLRQTQVTRGAFLGLTGSAMPGYKIELMVDGIKALETVSVDANGDYNLTFNTYRLRLGEHQLRVRQVDTQGRASDYSLEKSFSLLASFTPKADLNGDGQVDNSDWSIFMARFRDPNSKNRQELDLNGDGKVDTTDLGLFMSALGR